MSTPHMSRERQSSASQWLAGLSGRIGSLLITTAALFCMAVSILGARTVIEAAAMQRPAAAVIDGSRGSAGDFKATPATGRDALRGHSTAPRRRHQSLAIPYFSFPPRS